MGSHLPHTERNTCSDSRVIRTVPTSCIQATYLKAQGARLCRAHTGAVCVGGHGFEGMDVNVVKEHVHSILSFVLMKPISNICHT